MEIGEIGFIVDRLLEFAQTTDLFLLLQIPVACAWKKC